MKMGKSTKFRPTDAELEILQVLWERGPCSVRSVNDALSLKRDVGYTSTLKIMQIMTDKGLVTRDTEQRSHIYSANIHEADVQKSLLSRFLKTAFRGSAKNLVMETLGNHKASEEELREIKKYIEQIESSRNKKS
jgi:BlaI family penicillinase repressor